MGWLAGWLAVLLAIANDNAHFTDNSSRERSSLSSANSPVRYEASSTVGGLELPPSAVSAWFYAASPTAVPAGVCLLIFHDSHTSSVILALRKNLFYYPELIAQHSAPPSSRTSEHKQLL
jgi:hypothetical protein